MEEAYAGSCAQSLFEPKVDFSVCTNKSIKLFLKDLNSNGRNNALLCNESKNKLNGDSKREKDNENNSRAEDGKENKSQTDNSINNNFLTEQNKQKIVEENLSLLNGYLYFNRLGHNINLLNTELSSIKRDFIFLSKQTKRKIKKLKNIQKKKKIYKRLFEEVKEERKRKEMYEKLSIEINKLDDVKKVQKKQKREKHSIENFEKKIKNIESFISSNNYNILKTIEQINEIISTNLQIDNK